MAKAKGKEHQNLKVTPSPERKEIATRQVVLTLGVPEGDVLKVEKLGKSGQRHELSEDEFAALAGEDAAVNLAATLEEAYTAGITDAIKDELSQDQGDEEDEEEILRRFILRRAAGRKLLRRGVRQFVLRRVIRRELFRQRARPEHNIAAGAPSE